MAKKPTRGGRVTPKGTQPASSTKSASKAQPAIDHRVVNHFDPASQPARRRFERTHASRPPPRQPLDRVAPRATARLGRPGRCGRKVVAW